MAKDNSTKPTVVNINKNNISIIGENVLFNNGVITAFYLIPMANYSTTSESGICNTIDDLTGLFENLTMTYPDLEFTIERIEKIVKKEDVLANMYGTIKLYKEDYDMPIEFTKNVREDKQDYCILGINIEQSSIVDVEATGIKETAKGLLKQATNAIAGLGNMKADPEQILKIEESIYRTINYKCVRCSKDLVFYNFISKVYPCYEISYDKRSYINENSYEEIMGSIGQVVNDNFGYFEMQNDGVELFGQEAQPTYGCMIEIKDFPQRINAANFPLKFPNIVTTVKCLRKENASTKLKRIRASDRYEVLQGIEANAEFEQLETAQQNIRIATMALENIDQGEIIVEFTTTILVYAETKEELRNHIASVITDCKNQGMFARKCNLQAATFIDNYVNKKPAKMLHMAPITFPLCFQQNAGSTVGDIDGIWSPAIGTDNIEDF